MSVSLSKNLNIRKRFTALSLGLAMGAVSLLQGDVAERPNVLFIAVDDLKPSIGAFGDDYAITPHLDRLSARGTAFLNAHCQKAVCAPSRVSLLLGLRPHTTKVWDLKTKFREHLPDAVTLPQRFKQAGYTVVGMGKIFDGRSIIGGSRDMDAISWSEPYTRVKVPANRTMGYMNKDAIERIDSFFRNNLEATPSSWENRERIWPNGIPATDRADVPDNAYKDGAITDEAVRRLEGFADHESPFFLAVGYAKPHLPFNAPEKYWQMYERSEVPLAEFTELPEGAPEYAGNSGGELRSSYDVPKSGPLPEAVQRELVHGYYACVSYVDAQVGRLLDALDENGLSENTIIVLWGDHGYHLGDNGNWNKHTNYEQATRSPLIIVAPEFSDRAGVSGSPVEFIDVYPTLLELAGLESGEHLEGVSLLPIIDDPSVSVKSAAVSQYQRREKLGNAFRTDRYRLVQWRIIDYYAGERAGPLVDTELYDYWEDPHETRNLAEDPEYAAIRRELEAVAEDIGIGFE